jgi:hypothetical protein
MGSFDKNELFVYALSDYPRRHLAYTFADVFAECDMRLLEQLFVMDIS